MIEVDELTKSYGTTRAIDRIGFTARPGRVTALLGPNGAGKTTTLRILLGLSQPDAGRATIGGRPYRALGDPTRTVGALLEWDTFHPARSARVHLRALATLGGLAERRVEAVLDLVELGGAADRRPLVLAEPRRASAVVGRMAGYAVAGAAVGLAATVLSILLTYGWLAASGHRFDLGAGPLTAIVVGAMAYTALGTVLGGGLGWLARNQVAAAIAVFAYAMLDPPLAQAIPAYGRFGATALGVAMSGGLPVAGGPGQRLLPWPAATAVWAGAALVLAVAGVLATRRRELP